MIRLDRCRLFVAVAEKLSMSEAADSLCLTRSAVSHAIKALEGELGCTLFVRKNREVELTKDGQFFYDAATFGPSSGRRWSSGKENPLFPSRWQRLMVL